MFHNEFFSVSNQDCDDRFQSFLVETQRCEKRLQTRRSYKTEVVDLQKPLTVSQLS